MSIASEITRIKNNIASAYTALSDRGATLPVTQDSANLATTVESIPSGETITAINAFGSNIKSGDKVWLNKHNSPEEIGTDVVTGLSNNPSLLVYDYGNVLYYLNTKLYRVGFADNTFNYTNIQTGLNTYFSYMTPLFIDGIMTILKGSYISDSMNSSCYIVNPSTGLLNIKTQGMYIGDNKFFKSTNSGWSIVEYNPETDTEGEILGTIKRSSGNFGFAYYDKNTKTLLTWVQGETYNGNSRFLVFYDLSDLSNITEKVSTKLTDNSEIYSLTGANTGDIVFILNSSFEKSWTKTSRSKIKMAYRIKADGTLEPCTVESPLLQSLFDSGAAHMMFDNNTNILSVGTDENIYFFRFNQDTKEFTQITFDITLPTEKTLYSNYNYIPTITADFSTLGIAYTYGSSDTSNCIKLYKLIAQGDDNWYAEPYTNFNPNTLTGVAKDNIAVNESGEVSVGGYINSIQSSFSISNFDTIDDIRIDNGVMYANKKTATINTDYNVTFTPEQWKKELIIQLHIKTPSVFSNQWIMSNGSGWNTGIGMTMNSDINCAFWFCLGQSDTSKRKMLSGTTIPQADTEYWVRIYKQNTESFEAPTLLQISTDGINWITDTSVSIENITSDYTTNGAIRFFNLTTGSEYYTGGIYFDKDTFISIDGEKVWCLVKETGGSIPSGGKIITVTNTSSQNVQTGDKVWVNYKELTGQNQGATISYDFIASNFSQPNYVKYVERFDFSKPWEFKCKVFRNNYDYGKDRNAFIYSSVDSTSESLYTAGFSLYLGLGFSFHFRVDGTNQGIGGGTVNVNTTYWIKCGWTGTEYYLDYSTDGETYTSVGTFQSTSPVTQTNDNIDIGSSLWVSGFYWKGTIDLKEMSMTIDNEVVWKGLSDVSPKLVGYENSNYYSDTGIAKDNIAVGETGNVAIIV